MRAHIFNRAVNPPPAAAIPPAASPLPSPNPRSEARTSGCPARPFLIGYDMPWIGEETVKLSARPPGPNFPFPGARTKWGDKKCQKVTKGAKKCHWPLPVAPTFLSASPHQRRPLPKYLPQIGKEMVKFCRPEPASRLGLRQPCAAFDSELASASPLAAKHNSFSASSLVRPSSSVAKYRFLSRAGVVAMRPWSFVTSAPQKFHFLWLYVAACGRMWLYVAGSGFGGRKPRGKIG